MWGLKLISPPTVQITEVKPALPPPHPIKKPVVQKKFALKKVEQPQPKQPTIRYFW